MRSSLTWSNLPENSRWQSIGMSGLKSRATRTFKRIFSIGAAAKTGSIGLLPLPNNTSNVKIKQVRSKYDRLFVNIIVTLLFLSRNGHIMSCQASMRGIELGLLSFDARVRLIHRKSTDDVFARGMIELVGDEVDDEQLKL